MSTKDTTPSGDSLYRHSEEDRKDFELANSEDTHIEEISDHIEQHIGPIDSVFHEVVSDKVHIDVHWVKPNERFPFHTFVTSGMSDLPMNVPEGLEELRYAEVCILLPPDWPIKDIKYQLMEEIFKGEESYWPIRWLKIIARFPHDYGTWVGWGHTIPHGEEAAPFAPNTELGCMALFPSIEFSEKFFQLHIRDDKTIHFYCLYPIYKEEMEFKIKKGSDRLLSKFEKYNIPNFVVVDRINTCKQKGLFGFLKK